MRISRTKNSIRNAAFGLINKILSILLPFLVRTVFIHTLGVEFLGLNSLFSSILTVLNLTELGFSSAVVFCMYKPIAEDDTDTINALLLFYKKVYRYIGIIITCIGCLLIPFLGLFIKGTYPSTINLIVVYLIFLFNTTVSYFLYAYLSALIAGFQREDVISKVNIVVMTTMYLLQIFVLIVVKNYYVYILVLPIFTIINNIRTAIIAKKMFPQYRAFGELSKEIKDEIKEKVKGLLIFKLCYVSRNAFDSIFISMFLGLVDTAIYNNYYYIMNAVIGITSVLTSSVLAGAGNSVAQDSETKNYQDMNRMNFIYMWISGWFVSCMLCLYQPFMFVWVGEKLMYPISVVVLLCIYFYILKMGDVRYIYEQANGMWWEYRYRSIFEAIGNITLNWCLGKLFGIYGIIAATIITLLFINYFYGAKIIFKSYFVNENIADYFRQGLLYTASAVCAASITYFVTRTISFSFVGIVIRLLVCIFLPNIVIFLFLCRTREYKDTIPWIKKRIPILHKSI